MQKPDITCPYCRRENVAKIEMREQRLCVVCTSCSRVGPKKDTRRAAIKAWWDRFNNWMKIRKEVR